VVELAHALGDRGQAFVVLVAVEDGLLELLQLGPDLLARGEPDQAGLCV